VLLALGCGVDRPIQGPAPKNAPAPAWFVFPAPHDLDLLFVVDNSNLSLPELQQNLVDAFPQLLEALRSPHLGKANPGGAPCSQTDRTNCRIPNLHVGVVSTDVGAGSYALPSCEVAGGDGGKLHNSPRVAGCVPPHDPYISYIDGLTNVPIPGAEGIEQVKHAFGCIAALGTGGCGFEHPLEAARRALHPTLNVNPGFVRKDAMLAVVWVTDEDDCSAKKPQLFDPAQQGLTDPLGPLTSFRCTELGIQCDKNGRQPGLRHGCQPGFDWLYKVEDFAKFFAELKPPGRIVLMTLAGPALPFEVGAESDGKPLLLPSCKSGSGGSAVPAVRLATLMKQLGQSGFFNQGTSDEGAAAEVSVCSNGYGPALRLLGERLRANASNQCLWAPPLTPTGSLACQAGDVPGKNGAGQAVPCAKSCLDQVECVVEEGQGSFFDWKWVPVKKCPAALFDSAVSDCGTDCPCWRIVHEAACASMWTGVPYRPDVLRDGQGSSRLRVSCPTTPLRWGSTELAALSRCE